jgi:hypothetical protein
MKIATYLRPLPNPLPAHITKGQLAKARLGDMTFDYALPQQWLDHYVKTVCLERKADRVFIDGRPTISVSKFLAEYEEIYESVVGQCVTVYPPGNHFGEIVNLITGEILS